MSRQARHNLIRELLSAGPASSQEDLRAELASRGFSVTQATLSRDLAVLDAAKTSAGYTIPSSQSEHTNGALGALPRAAKEHLLSAEPAATTAVLRTPPGHAQALAIELDRTPPAGVVGTLAGDDTIFLACHTADDAVRTCAHLLELAGRIQS
ncbi:MAG: arginine repressor [Planctomycetota bacterium]